MKEYKIYFELFGKKLVTTVTASNPIQAKAIIRESIIFHNMKDVTPPKSTKNGFSDLDVSDFLGGFFK